jgi:hypothetical protein
MLELTLGALAALDTGRGASQHQGKDKKDGLHQAVLQLKIRSGLTPLYPPPPGLASETPAGLYARICSPKSLTTNTHSASAQG